MDFDFTEDQVMLRGLVREFLTEQCPVSHVRDMMENDKGYDADTYKEFVNLGITPFPEQYGGGGLGMIEQCIILEEMGRIPYPGPWFASILAGGVIEATGNENAMARYLPNLADGSVTASLAYLEDSLSWDPAGVQLQAEKSGDGYKLSGEKRFVPFAQSVDTLVVAARSGDELVLVTVPTDASGVTVTATPVLDLTSKNATVVFDNVEVAADDVVATGDAATSALEQALQMAALGASAEMLGASRKSLEMSTDYAKVRKQFGQFIGQFQAIKHMLADMLEQVENGHAAVYYAAWAVDADAPDKTMAISVAKSTLNENSKKVCGDAIQAHGGIGYTWEYDLHLYWKRAKYYEPMFGDTAYHREKILEEALHGRGGALTEAVV